ncbi:MAG TPA: HAD family phosphatase [Rhodocyclaceae bacterium]|nr:HAD family phosphatase [Rhodocyclaceae bacterium]
MYSSIKAYLLDLDGTLVASEPLKGRALADTCRKYGGEITAAAYIEVMGEDWPTVTRHFFSCAGIQPCPDAFNADFRERYLALLDEGVELTEGVASFISHARARGIRLALVSSAAPWMVERILARLDLVEAFDLVITQEHVTRHKPDPEAYLLALRKLGLAAQDVLVFEDSAAGLRAAAGAGCTSIVVRHAFNVRHDLSLARREISSFLQLLD